MYPCSVLTSLKFRYIEAERFHAMVAWWNLVVSFLPEGQGKLFPEAGEVIADLVDQVQIAGWAT